MSESKSSESPSKSPNPERVAAVVAFVAANPGCTKREASAAAAKQTSYGYRFVQAALDQGLIRSERNMNALGRPYALFPVQ